MKFFEKRPLSLILCIMLGGFSLFANSSNETKIILISASCFIFMITFVKGLFNFKKVNFFRICTALFAISIAFSILWQSTFFPNKYDDTNAVIEGEVIETTKNNNYTSVIINSSYINNEKASYKLKLYVYSNETVLYVGDVISFNATVNSIGAYEDHGESSYLLSDGISGVCYDVENISKTNHNIKNAKGFLLDLRKNITSRLIELTNEDTGGLLSSLIIGDREYLNPNTKLIFRRIGISHILALSGMHLAILTQAVTKLLRIAKVKKKARVILTMCFTLSYMTVVGFTPSITRSGLMLIIYYLLYLVARSHDSFTALSLAVFIIVLFSPYSVFDISLWLSAFATLGIITFSEMAKRKDIKRTAIRSCLSFIVNSVMCSIFAISFTLIFTVLKFDSISLLSIPATLIFSILIQILIYLGILLLILGGIVNFGGLLVVISDLIVFTADKFSSFEWALSSTNFVSAKILTIIFTAALVTFFILEIKHKKHAIAVLFILFLSIFICSQSATFAALNDNNVTYSSAESNNFVIKSDKEVAIIVADDITSTICSKMYSLTKDENITHIDRLILCGYTADMDSKIKPLIDNIMIDTIMIPSPMTDNELSVAEGVAELMFNYSSTIRFYKTSDILQIGTYTFTLSHRTTMLENYKTECVIKLTTEQEECFYFSRLAHQSAPLEVCKDAVECDTVIIGHRRENDKFDIYVSPTNKLICRDGDVLDTDYLEYVENTGLFEIIYTKEVIFN